MRFISYINGCCCRTHTDLKRDYFYVWHSSTGIIERLEVTDSVDWPSLVTPNTWYGGVAKEYVGKGTYATQIQNGDFSGLVFDEDGHLQDINYTSYDGREWGSTQRFTRTNMYQARVTPEKNTLYFIVEVYKEFFVTDVVYQYNETTRAITYIHPMCIADSNLYKESNWVIDGVGQGGVMLSSITPVQGGPKYNYANINEGKVGRGYTIAINPYTSSLSLGYREIILKMTTMDGVDVTYSPVYVYNPDNIVDNLVISKEPFTPLNPNYLSFTAKQPSTVTIAPFGTRTRYQINPNYTTYYSRDLETWNVLDVNTIVNLNTDEHIYLKGNGAVSTSYYIGQMFVMTGTIEAHGNIMSLCYGDEAEGKTTIPGDYCFYALFRNCASLITAPELPATSLTSYCYAQLFKGAGITKCPKLPAMTLALYCYISMFSTTSITEASELPATTLADYCYTTMFFDCESLTKAPALPATTLTTGCYKQMFRNCISLTTAPVLPALTVPDTGYSSMFDGCTSLSYIKMLATDINAAGSLGNWVKDVSPTGTFVKNSAATWDVTGVSGIPEGWTVETADA